MSPEPVATYRVQLSADFDLNKACELIPYLAELGISHFYSSPLMQAITDSTHGYNVVNYHQINVQLGGEEAFKKLIEALHKYGMGLVVDIVPNHMAINGPENHWWWNLLKYGPASRYAPYFDVDWEASDDRWPHKVLLPVLENHFGRVLEKGDLKLASYKGETVLNYKGQFFPIHPETLSQHNIEQINQDADLLERILSRQHYRLACWRMANKDLGYRRFFDIKDLIGLRMENEKVFLDTHLLPICWVAEDMAQGLRVDHPDGLRDPSQYFSRLKQACSGSWVVAEKILAPGEKLPYDWPVDGTTGYDFLNLVNRLFINSEAETTLTALYEEIVGEKRPFHELVYQSKMYVLSELFGSEVHALTSLFVQVCERHRNYCDYTRADLREAICQTAACFPVYRTYVSSEHLSESDIKYIQVAIEAAREKSMDQDPQLFHFFQDILLLKIAGVCEQELAMRFQQLTGPAMAKGFEDTALYRYNRFVALNEVGGDPGHFGISLDAFHSACSSAQKEHPYSLLASTTHDTKHSEDVRARLTLLSEIPNQFSEAVKGWMKHNHSLRERWPIDPNTEFMLYQIMIGAWPISEKRLLAYMEKAIREAKEKTSWNKPNKTYEECVSNFISELFKDLEFIRSLEGFVDPLVEAGHLNGLAQTLIKLTAPGVPDIYQGSELWNMSLVDPDNRQAVDFELRKQLLRQSNAFSMRDMDLGLPKLNLIRLILSYRKANPLIFTKGAYLPLYAEGPKKEHLIAFMRENQAITIVARFILKLGNGWEETSLQLPPGRWQCILTDQIYEKRVLIKDLFLNSTVCFLTLK